MIADVSRLIVILIGMALILVFSNPFNGRPPRNRHLGMLGIFLIGGASIYFLWVRFAA